MKIEIINFETKESDYPVLALKDFTSMIGVGGKVSLMVVISFDRKLLNKLVSVFMDGEEVSLEELEEIQQSVTGEVINTVVGLSLPTFPYRGKGTTITPPITINEISMLKKSKSSNILSTEIITEFGNMCVSIIAEKEFVK